MKLPYLFRYLHHREMEHCFDKYGPMFRIVPREPLGKPIEQLDDLAQMTVTVVSIRAVNDQGSVSFVAASVADLKVAEAWAKKHRTTPIDDFYWLPDFIIYPDQPPVPSEKQKT